MQSFGFIPLLDLCHHKKTPFVVSGTLSASPMLTPGTLVRGLAPQNPSEIYMTYILGGNPFVPEEQFIIHSCLLFPVILYLNTSAILAMIMLSMFSWTTFWLLYIAANLKVLPLAWLVSCKLYHTRSSTYLSQVRLFYGYFRHYYFNKRPIPTSNVSPAVLFQPTVYTSHTPLGELDHNMHKSNSTYLTDLDIARGHHLYCLFREGVNKYSSTKERKNGSFFPALGAVTISFKREIKPYQKYEIWTRVLTWDEKWVYMVSHFVEAGKIKPQSFSDQPWRAGAKESNPKQKGKQPVLYATAISKYVFKQGRKTIPPSIFLQACNLLPVETIDIRNAVSGSGSDVPQSNAFDKVGSNLSTDIEKLKAQGMAIAGQVAGLEDAHNCFTGHDDFIFAWY
jgi:hypothetical protein